MIEDGKNLHRITVYKVGFFRKAYACSCGVTAYGTSWPHAQLQALHAEREKEVQEWLDKHYEVRERAEKHYYE